MQGAQHHANPVVIEAQQRPLQDTSPPLLQSQPSTIQSNTIHHPTGMSALMESGQNRNQTEGTLMPNIPPVPVWQNPRCPTMEVPFTTPDSPEPQQDYRGLPNYHGSGPGFPSLEAYLGNPEIVSKWTVDTWKARLETLQTAMRRITRNIEQVRADPNLSSYVRDSYLQQLMRDANVKTVDIANHRTMEPIESRQEIAAHGNLSKRIHAYKDRFKFTDDHKENPEEYWLSIRSLKHPSLGNFSASDVLTAFGIFWTATED